MSDDKLEKDSENEENCEYTEKSTINGRNMDLSDYDENNVGRHNKKRVKDITDSELVYLDDYHIKKLNRQRSLLIFFCVFLLVQFAVISYYMYLYVKSPDGISSLIFCSFITGVFVESILVMHTMIKATFKYDEEKHIRDKLQIDR